MPHTHTHTHAHTHTHTHAHTHIHTQVPFSASNYLLGLTPVQMPAFLGGTLGGMAVWSVLYASLGGASRKLLDNGADIGSLLTGVYMSVMREPKQSLRGG